MRFSALIPVFVVACLLGCTDVKKKDIDSFSASVKLAVQSASAEETTVGKEQVSELKEQTDLLRKLNSNIEAMNAKPAGEPAQETPMLGPVADPISTPELILSDPDTPAIEELQSPAAEIVTIEEVRKELELLRGGLMELYGMLKPLLKPQPVKPVKTIQTVQAEEGTQVPSPAPPVVTLTAYTASWCSPCRHMRNNVYPSLSVMVDKIDFDMNRQYCQQIGITTLPTIDVMKDGVLFKRFVGAQTAQTIETAIQGATQ